MVLRDKRDKRTPKTTGPDCTRKNKVGLWWRGTECNPAIARLHLKKKRRRKNRVNIKKNINKSIVVSVKETIIEQKEKVEKETDVCSICYEVTENLKYINCKQGGVQSVNFGRYGECCKDKPICPNCQIKCGYNCPFCHSHTLYNWKKAGRGSKKKEPFAIRHKKQIKKLFKHLKKKRKTSYFNA
jgi:hypothetical protein